MGANYFMSLSTRRSRRLGLIRDDEAVDRIINGPYGVWTPKRRKSTYGSTVKCKHCGSTDVCWRMVGGKYKLHNKDDLSAHDCFAKPNANGFDEVTSEPEKAPLTNRRSASTGKPVCHCGRGYASEADGLCTNCRHPRKHRITPSFQDLGIL